MRLIRLKSVEYFVIGLLGLKVENIVKFGVLMHLNDM